VDPSKPSGRAEGSAADRASSPGIVETLPPDELEALPKLSTTLVDFAQPILTVYSNPPTRANVEMAMMYAMVAWNLPLYEQAGGASELVAQWREIAPTLPAPVLTVLEAMMRERRTRYRHDPRLASVEVRDGEDGQAVILAAYRLVGAERTGI
jgi:hypothetical protein